jgi:hypothetical protein
MPDLQPDGSTIFVGVMRLRTPGMSGTAEVMSPATQGTRLEGLDEGRIDAALRRQRVETMESIQIEVTDPASQAVETGVVRTDRSTRVPVVEMEVPNLGPNVGQVVLSIDEQGLVTWNFPIAQDGTPDVTRGGGDLLFQIRGVTPAPTDGAGTRGVLGAIGRKVLRVLAFPLIEAGSRLIADDIAEFWEKRKRPYNLRSFEPGSQFRGSSTVIESGLLNQLSDGPVLLLLHGTFSRAHGAFGKIPNDDLATLHRRYGGRVIAFDHYTMAHDPIRNIEELLTYLPADAQLEFDILSHSRGGLVGRTLTEMQSALSLGQRSIRVRRHVLVAAPNAGTALVDTKYLGDLIDSYTNILQFLPSNGVTETLEAIILVAKHIAAGAVDGLPGLQSMLPGGSFLGRINVDQTATPEYFALAANYEPVQAGLKEWAKDRLFDTIFEAGNDLVVPTDGVWEVNGSNLFAIQQRRVFPASDGVWHSGFFQNADARAQVLDWLPG